MKNGIQRLILALALTGLGGSVLAQAPPAPPPSPPEASGAGPSEAHERMDRGWHGRHHHHHWRHHRHRWGEGPLGWRGHGEGPVGGLALLRSLRTLNLSEAQQQQVHTILDNARTQRAGKIPLAPTDRLVLANPGDPGYASAVQAAKARAAERIQNQSDLNQQLYQVLSADQKAQLSKTLANWKARIAQRREESRGPPFPASR